MKTVHQSGGWLGAGHRSDRPNLSAATDLYIRSMIVDKFRNMKFKQIVNIMLNNLGGLKWSS